jgi:DUF1680 family protein
MIMNSIGRDSDVAKWVEAACYMLIESPDPELAHLVEEAVDMIRGAQREDGYINTYYTVRADCAHERTAFSTST